MPEHYAASRKRGQPEIQKGPGDFWPYGKGQVPGYRAEILRMVCEAYLKTQDADELAHNQHQSLDRPKY